MAISMTDGKFPTSLTPQQLRFMLALQARLEAKPDVSPTYDELRQDLGLASKSGIFRLVTECEERGRIARKPFAERTLTILKPVTSDEFDHKTLLSSFSDKEILQEALNRGLLSLSVNKVL